MYLYVIYIDIDRLIIQCYGLVHTYCREIDRSIEVAIVSSTLSLSLIVYIDDWLIYNIMFSSGCYVDRKREITYALSLFFVNDLIERIFRER